MANENKKSILEDALTEYKQIQEVAEAIAAKKLAKQFPEKFEKLLKEELEKNNNNKSENEPYKMVKNNESKNLDESDNKNVDNKMEKETKKETKEVVNEERDKSFTTDVEKDTPNLESGKEKGVAFDEKTSSDSVANKKNVKEGTKKEEVAEEFDITNLDLDSAENAIDNVDDDDEIVTMKEIEEEIAKMEDLKSDLDSEKSDPFVKLASFKEKLQEMLNSVNELEEQKLHGGQGANKVNPGGPTTAMIDEDDVEEQKLHGGQGANKVNPGGPTTAMIDEDEPITDADIDAVLGADENDVDEAMGIAHSSSKQAAGDNLPGPDFAKHRHKRYGSVNNPNESVNKKFEALLEENKQLSKRIIESKKYKETVEKLLENYKTALEKYRTQLKDMAVFNTNLAHVNNILVNEEIALTQEDKIKVINEFKTVKTIGESKEKYEKFLSEMKDEKKVVSEIEDKLNESIGKSSKETLVEEKTAYADNEHIKKMKEVIEYVEKRDRKK